MSKPKLHQQPEFASGPLILTFAKMPAETPSNVRIGPLAKNEKLSCVNRSGETRLVGNGGSAHSPAHAIER
jgi:hypothetical protein